MSKGRASAPFTGVGAWNILYLLNQLVNFWNQVDSSIYFAAYELAGACRVSANEQWVYESVQLWYIMATTGNCPFIQKI